MNGNYLLDTNTIIALFADDEAVKDNIARANEVFVPSIAIGELCFGARKSGRVDENLARIDEFAAALQYDLTLVSRDTHFVEIEDLKLATW
jgi:tRNA(fMet)-specific endonuclease VapC